MEEGADSQSWSRSEASFAEILCGYACAWKAEVTVVSAAPDTRATWQLTPNHPSLVEPALLLPESRPLAGEDFAFALDPETTGSPTYRQQSTSNRSSSRLMSERLRIDDIVRGNASPAESRQLSRRLTLQMVSSARCVRKRRTIRGAELERKDRVTADCRLRDVKSHELITA